MASARQLLQDLPATQLGAHELPARGGWCLEALRGRLVELGGAGGRGILTVAFGLVLEAQRQGEPVAWLCARGGSFYPPDVAAGGVDLEALVVVLAPDARAAARQADRLARSGAFGLLVLDLSADAAIPTPLLSRIAKLVRRHRTALLALTDKPSGAPSLDALVSLRAQVERRRAEGGFELSVRVLKDKRRGPGLLRSELHRAPPGLR